MEKNVISSDDPKAIEKLKEKLKNLTSLQNAMKSVNRIAKSKRGGYSDEQKVVDLQNKFGYREAEAKAIMVPDFCGRIGFADYKLTNNNATIRTVKQRIKKLEAQSQDETSSVSVNGVEIKDNVEDNRIQVFFDDKPSEIVRGQLKRNGFRWSGLNGCWQSYRGFHYIERAKAIINNTM